VPHAQPISFFSIFSPTESDIIAAQNQALKTQNIASIKIESSRSTQLVLFYTIDWLHVSTLWGHHQVFTMDHFVKHLRTLLGSQTMFTNFAVLLTVHLSLFISIINQLEAKNFCFTISLFRASTCFEHKNFVHQFG